MKFLFVLLLCLMCVYAYAAAPKVIYKYTLNDDGTVRAYDEALAAACMQGILNREKPVVWVTAQREKNADVWEEILTKDGHWLEGAKWKELTSLDELRELAGKKLKGCVVWDPDVPATVNAATTMAGVEDLVVLSPEFAEEYAAKWNLEIKHDLRGMFDGSETGSKKNDVYRYMIREYLEKGLCSKDFLFLNTDSFVDRAHGTLTYTLTKDWPVCKRGFVFDLSPWGTEKPGDDPDQPMGTDLATYKIMLSALERQTNGKQMTEMAGFFDFAKYSNYGAGRNHPVGTEWETVFTITPYNVFQNTADHNCYNKSFHSKFAFKNLKQKINKKPKVTPENKVYLCVLMADFDSSTPLYVFMPKYWADPNRGKIPLGWGINPNLINTYPDVISYYYETATPNDFFTADATCAGYFNPVRILPENMDLFVKHNKYYYKKLDMDISPMVLDMEPPTSMVKDAFAKFSPHGACWQVGDWHQTGAKNPEPQIWKGMVLDELYNCGDFNHDISVISGKEPGEPAFYYMRLVWQTPTEVIDYIDRIKAKLPEYDFEIVDPYTFMELRRQDLKNKGQEIN